MVYLYKNLLFLILYIFKYLLLLLAESFNVTCSKSLLLEVNKNGSLNCLVEELISEWNSSPQISVAKSNGGNCSAKAEKPIIQVRDSVSDNQTKSITVLFHHVTLQSTGNYSLKVIFGNATKESNFSMEVYGICLCTLLYYWINSYHEFFEKGRNFIILGISV